MTIRKREGMKKAVRICFMAVVLSAAMVLTAFAGTWKQNSSGWWYADESGSYPVSSWQRINGRWYYFNGAGYMAASQWIGNYYLGSDGVMMTDTITPDGYKVGADGAWIRNTDQISEEDLLNEIREKTGLTEYSHIMADFNGDGAQEMVAAVCSTGNDGRHTEVHQWYTDGSDTFEFAQFSIWWLKECDYTLIPTGDGIQLGITYYWRQAADGCDSYIYSLQNSDPALLFTGENYTLKDPQYNSVGYTIEEASGAAEGYLYLQEQSEGRLSYSNGKFRKQ